MVCKSASIILDVALQLHPCWVSEGQGGNELHEELIFWISSDRMDSNLLRTMDDESTFFVSEPNTAD